MTDQTIDTRWLAWGLGTYAVLILISMASMSIGIGIVLLSLVMACHGLIGFYRLVTAEFLKPDQLEMRRYFGLTVFLSLACALSLLYASAYPLGYGGRFAEIHFRADMAKSWYFFWPLILVPGIRLLSQRQKFWIL